MRLFILTFIFMVFDLLACPNCAGSNNAQDKYTYLILGGFIILCYIPFYILFRIAKTSDPSQVKSNSKEKLAKEKLADA